MTAPLPETVPGRSRALMIAAALAIAALMAVCWYIIQSKLVSFDALAEFTHEHRTAGPVIYVLVHSLAAVAFVPCSPLTALAGVLWEQPYAVIYSMLGAITSSCVTFALARFLAAKWFRQRLNNPAVKWVFQQVEAHGWQTVAFTQINPIFPGSTLGYVFGLSAIPFRVYVISSVVFMIPLQLMLVTVGQSFRTILLPGESGSLVIQIVIMLVTGLVLLVLKPLTRKLLGAKSPND